MTNPSTAVLFPRKQTFSATVKEAIKQSSLSARDKLKLRVVMAVKPGAKEAIEEFLLEKVNSDEAAMSIASVDTLIDLDQLEKLLALLIKYLPALIEIFTGLFG